MLPVITDHCNIEVANTDGAGMSIADKRCGDGRDGGTSGSCKDNADAATIDGEWLLVRLLMEKTMAVW